MKFLFKALGKLIKFLCGVGALAFLGYMAYKLYHKFTDDTDLPDFDEKLSGDEDEFDFEDEQEEKLADKIKLAAAKVKEVLPK